MIRRTPTSGPRRRAASVPILPILFGLAVLAGCQATPPGGGDQAPSAAAPPAVSEPEPIPVADPPAEESAPPAEPAAEAVDLSDLGNTAPAVAALPGVDDLPGPESLVGDLSTAVEAMLGPPHFRRRDAPAEIWQYRGDDCVLDFFLYDEPGGQRVDHVEARSLNVMQSERDACYRRLVADYRRLPGG